ncbi:hypothetical protein Psta_4199 [Pirellula staleyi DSM 6068]|uniref:Uncharacterized protein n=1 Tax=Pirellula staleyi (strain ATCC 27377 / DSM 6068 / ICPB 4128) TaxID=530564 RepID=D2R3Z8_PIRSD|nr:hypothetical protein [Pirellula staleyi]ADB18847.1 hypothetical protein Psta_4199 [Pirellula staleyi DSM 6068]
MRQAAFGIGAGLLLAAVMAVCGLSQAMAQKPAVSQSAGGLHDRALGDANMIALSCDTADGRQQITLVDPRQRVIAVYHVDKTSGAVTLRSIRNVQWDLLMEDYNSGAPTPRDIRALAAPR